MFMRFVHLSISGEYEASFKKLYNISVLPLLQKMEGCKMADLIRSNSENGEYISITLWDEKSQAEKFERSETYKILTAQINLFLAESSEWKIQLTDDYEIDYKPTVKHPIRKNYTIEATTKSKIDSSKHIGMFTRIVSIKVELDKQEEFKRVYSSEIIPILDKTEGCIFVYLIEGIKDKNEFLSFTVWENQTFAEQYEKSGIFLNLLKKLEHTFSKFYLWKMNLEQNIGSKVDTNEDLKIDNYTIVTARKFS